MNLRHVVLEYVADNPDMRYVGNRERVGRGECLHTRGVRDLLIGDHSGNRCENFDDARRLVGIGAKEPEMLCCGLQIDDRVVLSSLRNFEPAFGDSAVVEQDLGPNQLYFR